MRGSNSSSFYLVRPPPPLPKEPDTLVACGANATFTITQHCGNRLIDRIATHQKILNDNKMWFYLLHTIVLTRNNFVKGENTV